jgi:hypothetical protein
MLKIQYPAKMILYSSRIVIITLLGVFYIVYIILPDIVD